MRTVTISAFSRYPRFEPAKTQRMEIINAVRVKRRGRIAGRRMRGAVGKNDNDVVEVYLDDGSRDYEKN